MGARIRTAGRGDALGKLTARVRQIAWTLHYLDDLRSDFSVLHRVDEIGEMPGPRFFAYCYRLSAYQGAIAAEARRTATARAQRVAAGPVSIGEWARTHKAAMEAASESSGGR